MNRVINALFYNLNTTQLDLVIPNLSVVLKDPEQEEAKMLGLDIAEPEVIA